MLSIFGFLLFVPLLAQPSQTGVWTTYPNSLPNDKLPDLPILGNGVLGIILDSSSQNRNTTEGSPGIKNSVDFWLNTNSFWSCTACSSSIDPDNVDISCCAVVTLGGVSIRVPSFPSPLPSFYATQSISTATLSASLGIEGGSAILNSSIFMHPRDSLVVLNITVFTALTLELATWVSPSSGAAGHPSPARAGCATASGIEAPACDDARVSPVSFVSRNASTVQALTMPVAGALATAVLLGPGAVLAKVAASSERELVHTINIPAGSWAVAFTGVAVTRGPGITDPVPAALALTSRALTDGASAVRDTASEWWGDFWSHSGVELPTRPALQELFYGAAYVLAGASPTFSSPDAPAPGLYGPWATLDNPAWQGDYTLDYNYAAPYYGVFASGHGGLAEGYWRPILDWMSPSGILKARMQAELAHLTDCAPTALYFNCHLAPWGQSSLDPMARFMTWNLPHALLLFVNHFEYTLNASFAETVIWPAIAGTMDWYACYLTYNATSGLWRDDNPWNPDYEHEGQPTKNPTIALALIQRLANAAVAVSTALGITPPPSYASISKYLSPASTLQIPLPSPRNYTLLPNNRCSNVAKSWTFYDVPSVEACEALCDSTETCTVFSYCPPVSVNNASGCTGREDQPAPFTCWGMPISELPHCTTNGTQNAGWMSGWTSGNAPTNKSSSNVSVWATYEGQTSVSQGDWFASYFNWPSEAIDPASPANEASGVGVLARATASLYGSNFAGGRGVDLATTAVRAGKPSSSPHSSNGGGPLAGFTPAYVAGGIEAFLSRWWGRNQLAYAPGGGIENTGMNRAVCDMLLQSYPSVGVPGGLYTMELFPFWPANESASFFGLHAKGGFAVTAAFDGLTGQVKPPVNITAVHTLRGDNSSVASLINPWQGKNVTVICGGSQVDTTWHDFEVFAWAAPLDEACLVAPTEN